MVDTDNDNQKKRRLPLWMLGVVAADKIRKAGSSDDNVAIPKDSASQRDLSKEKPVAERHDKRGNCEAEAADMYQNTVGFKSRKKARKSSQRGLEIDKPEANIGLHKKKSRRKREKVVESVQELEHTINVKKNKRSKHNAEKGEERESFSLSDRSEDDAEPTYRTFEEDLSSEEDLEVKMDSQVRCKSRKKKSGGVTRVTRDKKRAKNARLHGGSTSQKQTIRKKKTAESSEDIEGSSSGEGREDEVDLTVDDLMNIAQEHVRAVKEKEIKKALLEELEPNSTLTNTSNTSTYESSGSIHTTGSIPGVSKCCMRESASYITEKTKEIATRESIPVNVNKTGDAKADMLALFLGPSWNKSSAAESNLDKFFDSSTFSLELEKPIESQAMAEGEMPPPPVMKKKSSLKDKVSMFFDL